MFRSRPLINMARQQMKALSAVACTLLGALIGGLSLYAYQKM